MRERDFQRSVRRSENKQLEFLRRLDGASGGGGNRRRTAARHTYLMPNVHICIAHPGGGEVKFLVCTRNLSAGGMSFLHGGFLHNRTQVIALLPTLEGQIIAVNGSVVMCRYLADSMHEVGVTFVEKIDPARFIDSSIIRATPLADADRRADEPILGDVLCVVQHEVESRLLDHHLRTAGVQTVIATRTGAAADQLARQPFDLVFVDLDGADGAGAISTIRAGAFAGPIIALTSRLDTRPPADRSWGVAEVITKPYDVHRLIGTTRTLIETHGQTASATPIYSELAAGPGSAELVESFISHARTTMAHMHAAIAAGDRAKAQSLSMSVRTTAAGYGFPQLGDVAEEVIARLERPENKDELSASVARLESMVRKLRARRDAA